MGGLTITDVKIVEMCSKHRKEGDKIPKNIHEVPYEDKDIACVACAIGPPKVQGRWEIMKEQEIEFRKGMPEFVNGIETELFFKGIRQTEYRRGKEDGVLATDSAVGSKK